MAKRRKRRRPVEILADEKARLELDTIRLRRSEVRRLRKEQVLLSSYAAAEKHRLTQDWPYKTVSADRAIITDSRTLNARARLAVRDNWMGRSVVRAYRRRVVGIGITPKSAAADPRTGEVTDRFKQFNQEIDWWWRRWARNRLWCDSEKRKSFTELEGLSIEEFAVVGEALALVCYVPTEEMVGLRIQMLEPEQLDSEKMRNPDTGNEVRGGVEIDGDTGAAVAYWLYVQGYDTVRRTRGGSKRIPADRVLHVFRQERARQTRGVTAFSAALVKMWHTQMYEEYQLIAARLEACQGGAIETATPESGSIIGLPYGSGDSGTDSQGATEVVMEPGMMPKLPPGAKVNWRQLSRPGNQYDPFVKAQIGHVAASLGLDYAQVARDFSQGNFSSQRQGTLEVDKELDAIEKLLIDAWCRPVREAFKLYAVLEGRVQAPGFFDSPEMTAAYMEDVWQGPPKPWIDPAKQAAAAKIMLDYMLTTRRDIFNERGVHVEEQARQSGREREIYGDEGIELPEAAKGKPKVAKQEPRPAKKQPEENEPAEEGRERDRVTEAVLADALGPELAEIVMSEEE